MHQIEDLQSSDKTTKYISHQIVRSLWTKELDQTEKDSIWNWFNEEDYREIFKMEFNLEFKRAQTKEKKLPSDTSWNEKKTTCEKHSFIRKIKFGTNN